MPERISVDVLVIGSGVAGLSYALRVADDAQVAIVTKKECAESNTNYAQGGIAAVMAASDSYEQHAEDTLIAGAGLCDPEVVDVVVREGPQRLRELMAWGAEFTETGNGKLHLGREGGHSANRIVHAADATGQEVERALLTSVRQHPNIEVYEYHYAIDLITEHHLGQHVTRLRDDVHCFGAYVLDEQADV
ncbi:MAG: FAD-dependent oxidoreductase, partial [Bacteroidetes bacterium]|nr:FAD-dependent oxidoreductase [Bacteroidota bacterium]